MDVVRLFFFSPLLATASLTACVNTLDELSTVRAGVGSSDPAPTSTSTQESSCTEAQCSECSGDSCSSNQADAAGSQNATTGSATYPDAGVAPGVACGPGTFIAESDGGIQCRVCPEGAFSSSRDATECVLWNNCEAGEFITNDGSASKDRECAPCPTGETSAVNANTCSAIHCAAGAAKGAEGVCVDCEAGTYCNGGVDPLVPCGGATWDDDSDATTPCVDKATCVAGQYVEDDGTSTLNRSCANCDVNTFSVEDNSAQCTPFSSCEAGSFVFAAGTSMKDTECMECAPGTFSLGVDATTCTTWTECAAPGDRMATEPSAVADRTCEACAAPTITLEDNESACGLYAFQMTSGAVVVEAENFYTNQARGTSTWSTLQSTGLSGDACVEVGPDVGTAWTSDPATTAPRLDYRVNIPDPGVYYLHIRGDAGASSNGDSDSCYGGMAGAPLQYTFAAAGGTWGWMSQSFNVQTAGLHLISLYGREDGFRADKFVLSNAATPPPGIGPAESEFVVPESE